MMFRLFGRERRLIVVRRQSPDWSDIGPAYWRQLAEFETMIGRAPGSVRDLIERWNASVAISFFAFRREVARITAANLARLPAATVVDLDGFRKRRFDRSALYVFTDDDDWFSPRLPLELARADIRGDGIVWRSVAFRGHVEIRDLGPCTTNNYAVLGAALARDPDLPYLAEQHFRIDGAVRRGRIHLDRLDMPLSITNKHPASTMTLERATERHGEAGVRQAIAEAQARMRIAIDLDAVGVGWARDETEAMRRLVLAL